MFSSPPTSLSQKLQVKNGKGLSPPTSPNNIDGACLFEKGLQENKEGAMNVDAPHSRQSIYLLSIHETCCMLAQNFFEEHYKHNPYFLNRMRMNPDNILELFKENASSFGSSDLNYQSLYEAIQHIENEDFNVTSYRTHTSILMDAVEGKWHTKPETIQKLIELGASVHAIRADGLSVLMVAAKNNSPWRLDILQILVQAEVDIYATDDRGRTFLMHFVSKPQSFGEAEKVFLEKFLVNGNWVTEACKNRNTAFMYAAKAANRDVMRFLLARGAAQNVPAAKAALKIFKANVEENYALEFKELNSFSTIEINYELVFPEITEFDYIDDMES